MAIDAIHHAVKNALIKDGWTITDDPFTIEYEEVTVYADLAAERTVAAERGSRMIVVENQVVPIAFPHARVRARPRTISNLQSAA